MSRLSLQSLSVENNSGCIITIKSLGLSQVSQKSRLSVNVFEQEQNAEIQPTQFSSRTFNFCPSSSQFRIWTATKIRTILLGFQTDFTTEIQTSKKTNGTKHSVFGQTSEIQTKTFRFWTIGPKIVRFWPKLPETEHSKYVWTDFLEILKPNLSKS